MDFWIEIEFEFEKGGAKLAGIEITIETLNIESREAGWKRVGVDRV